MSRPRNSEATRADLLHAAMRRFTVLGYDRTTTRDVAADAGVNVSLINRYFGSKDGLFAAVMAESSQILEETQDPTPLVEAILRDLGKDAWPEFGGEHPLLLLLRGAGDDERVAELRRRSLERVVTRLAGELEADEDVRLRAELLIALVAGTLTLRAALPDGELADTDRLRAVLERAISALVRADG